MKNYKVLKNRKKELMSKIMLKGNPINTVGTLPAVGTQAKNFKLVKNDLSEATLESYAGKIKIFNIFPSIDTPTCAKSVRKFNEDAAKLSNTVILNVSADLPFAQSRFCGAEGIKNAETLSSFKSTIGQDWGLTIQDSPLSGLLSRAVIILSSDNKVLYTEQVSDIVNEPNYEAALKSIS